MDLSSEWELCLEPGEVFLDLSGDLEHLVEVLGFATDLLLHGNFSERLSRVWLISGP